MDEFSKESLARKLSEEVLSLWNQSGPEVVEDRIYQAACKISNLRFQAYASREQADRCLEETRQILEGFGTLERTKILAQAFFEDHQELRLRLTREDLERGNYRKAFFWDFDIHRKGKEN